MKLSADCINQDHRALGSHTIDGVPFEEACLYPTDLVWAEATNQPPAIVDAPAVDDARHQEARA